MGELQKLKDGIVTRATTDGMLEQEDYPALDKAFSFVVTFVDRRTEHKNTTPKTWVYTRQGENVPDVIVVTDSGHEAGKRWTSWKEVKDRSKMLLDAFDEHLYFFVCTIVSDTWSMVSNKQRLLAPSTLESHPFDNFRVHIKHWYRINFEKETKMNYKNSKFYG